jgi:hypothetical protein
MAPRATAWAPRSSTCKFHCRLICRVFFSCCESVAWPQGTVWAPRPSTCDAQGTAPRATAWAPRSSTCDKQLPTHLPIVLLLQRQRRVAAGNGLGTGLGTTITYVRPKLRPTTPPRRRYIGACVTLPHVHIWLIILTQFLCSLSGYSSSDATASRRNRQRSKHQPEHHNQVRATYSERRRGQRPRHHSQVPATHNERRRGQQPYMCVLRIMPLHQKKQTSITQSRPPRLRL